MQTAPATSVDVRERLIEALNLEMPESAGLAEESTEERKAAKKGFFPSSMGLSFLVPEDSDTVSVTVRRADYGLGPIEDDPRFSNS